jgi:ABC-type lipoprotein export system ATPase subunit
MNVSPAAPAALLRAVDLHKRYSLGRRDLDVLQGVSLTLNPGEFIALRGASGAGKSTLLHLLGGLDTPSQGEIWLRGESLAGQSASARARARNESIGFIFQAYHLLPELDAVENVCLPARLGRRPARATEVRARELLTRVGLGERLEHKPYELSGGEQQRVAIARALITAPAVILADEPTGNLDTATGASILALLSEVAHEEGRRRLVVMVTHNPDAAAATDRVITLQDGRLGSDEMSVVPG